MRWNLFSALLVIILTLTACQKNDLQNQVSEVTVKLSANLTAVRESAEEFARAAEQVYSSLDKYDLSTKGLDVKDGGIFDTFQNNTYYYKTVPKGASYYVSPMKPVDDTLRREIRILQQIEGSLEAAYAENSDSLGMAFYGVYQPTSIALLVPWADVVSFFPPGIDLRKQEWYDRGLTSRGEARWSKKPFVSFYRGWVEDVAVPIYDKGTVRGVVVLATALEKIGAKYFADKNASLVLLGPDLTPFAATPKARTELPLKVIQDFDYTKQLKANPLTDDEYRLSASGQPRGLQDLATAIGNGQTSFEIDIDANQYRVYVQEIKDPRFYVAGFARR